MVPFYARDTSLSHLSHGCPHQPCTHDTARAKSRGGHGSHSGHPPLRGGLSEWTPFGSGVNWAVLLSYTLALRCAVGGTRHLPTAPSACTVPELPFAGNNQPRSQEACTGCKHVQDVDLHDTVIENLLRV